LWDKIKSELLRIAREQSLESLPRFLGDLEEIRRTAEVQLSPGTRSQPDRDVLLNVSEASKRLNVSKDTLYRNEFAFTRHFGRRRLFSRDEIEKAIQQNDLTPVRIDGNLTHPKNRKRLN
jgi:excisionase family DNA binding protein